MRKTIEEKPKTQDVNNKVFDGFLNINVAEGNMKEKTILRL